MTTRTKTANPHRRSALTVLLVAAFLSSSGCGTSDPSGFSFNEVDWLKQERLSLDEGDHFPASYKAEVEDILAKLFGTPDQPVCPTALTDVVDAGNLQAAAGAVNSDQQGTSAGLYRKHCVHCHGVTGDGAGPTAGYLAPYPRDFRLGKFKFKSTPLRKAPTDQNLVDILRQGIPGTAMPSFDLLPTAEIAALVDYVKYLSIRGEVERALAAEVSLLDGQPLLEPSELASLSPENAQQVLDAVLFADVIDRWREPEQHVTRVPTPPAAFQIGNPGHADLTSLGRQLFFAKGNCAECHGETAAGDGKAINYDDWTNEWLKTPGVDLVAEETWEPFLDAGAFPPRTVRPRNLNLGVFRGGDRPEDMYRRLANGIEGTPMPASTALTPDELWALVSYVQSLQHANDPYLERTGKTALVSVSEN